MAIIDANGVEWVYMKNPLAQKETDAPVKVTKAAFDEVWGQHPVSPWKIVDFKPADAAKEALEAITAHAEALPAEQAKGTTSSTIDASQGSNAGKVA